MLLQITEYLDIDLAGERWRCNRCGADLGDARESYKKGCLIHDRDPREIHFPIGPSKEFNFAPDPKWMRIVEFYCPGCGVMVENEYLPPGHPLTWDIQLDVDKLKKKYGVKGRRANVGVRPQARAAKARVKGAAGKQTQAATRAAGRAKSKPSKAK
jgi:acetone carboxylase, gamma subunit